MDKQREGGEGLYNSVPGSRIQGFFQHLFEEPNTFSVECMQDVR